MKIDPKLQSLISGASAPEASRTGRSPAGAGGDRPRSSVELSPLAARLNAIEAGLDARKVVDAARVAEIKQAIAEGRFSVNAEAVADRLIETARDLLRAHKA